jgi:hypothetical protein
MKDYSYKKLTWANGYECHLLKADGTDCGWRCVVPQYYADHQKEHDGETFMALTWDGQNILVRLVGSDYGLHTTGTGDMTVREAV